ncbi:uncharacterized protein LOC133736151 [Rosa rugosa]|uniref:uncharacterized protein LOC133736151 n=1 Tax=Rosa rugosa TaxID=74645 RepID=UPI002B407951|nr:uncharacterized protein LOC133736151 [Rosa rugosa]
MDAQGFLCSERAPKRQGKDLDYGPEYRRSLPLNSISLTVSLESRPTWVTTANLNSGHLRFDPHAEDGVIKNVRYFGAHFDAHTLMKANNEEDGDDKFPVGEDFYLALHRMLKCKKDWGEDFCFRGRAVFAHGILEWTETTLTDFEETLDKAGIFGAVAVSRYPYEYCSNVWRAFCELWGALTNTFHHADGEMSISLHDLNVIGGLPVSGESYEEFVPPNKDLVKVELYPPTVAELLRIYTYLCAAYKSRYVYWPWWIEHFYRGEIIYGAYGECKNSGVPKLREPKLELKISKQGRLAAFLAFWLSRFVLPSNSKKIRPETFYMVSLMAQGIRVSLAPTVLGYVYHGLALIITTVHHRFKHKKHSQV